MLHVWPGKKSCFVSLQVECIEFLFCTEIREMQKWGAGVLGSNVSLSGKPPRPPFPGTRYCQTNKHNNSERQLVPEYKTLCNEMENNESSCDV